MIPCCRTPASVSFPWLPALAGVTAAILLGILPTGMAVTTQLRAAPPETTTSATRSPPTGPAERWSTELLTQVNELRAAEQLQPVQLNPKLTLAAQRHADHMATTGKVGHEEIGDGTIRERLSAVDYRHLAFAENIAWGPAEPAAALRLWVGSPPHLKNLQGAYAEIGLGRAVADDGKVYWVAVFGTQR